MGRGGVWGRGRQCAQSLLSVSAQTQPFGHETGTRFIPPLFSPTTCLLTSSLPFSHSCLSVSFSFLFLFSVEVSPDHFYLLPTIQDRTSSLFSPATLCVCVCVWPPSQDKDSDSYHLITAYKRDVVIGTQKKSDLSFVLPSFPTFSLEGRASYHLTIVEKLLGSFSSPRLPTTPLPLLLLLLEHALLGTSSAVSSCLLSRCWAAAGMAWQQAGTYVPVWILSRFGAQQQHQDLSLLVLQGDFSQPEPLWR